MDKLYNLTKDILSEPSNDEAKKKLFGINGIDLNSTEYYEEIISQLVKKKENIITKVGHDICFDLRKNIQDVWNIIYISKYILDYWKNKATQLGSKSREFNNYNNNFKDTIRKKAKRVKLLNISNIDENSLPIDDLKFAIAIIEQIKDSFGHRSKNTKVKEIFEINNKENFKIEIPANFIECFIKGKDIKDINKDISLEQEVNKIVEPIHNAVGYDVIHKKHVFCNVKPNSLSKIIEYCKELSLNIHELPKGLFYRDPEYVDIIFDLYKNKIVTNLYDVEWVSNEVFDNHKSHLENPSIPSVIEFFAANKIPIEMLHDLGEECFTNEETNNDLKLEANYIIDSFKLILDNNINMELLSKSFIYGNLSDTLFFIDVCNKRGFNINYLLSIIIKAQENGYIHCKYNNVIRNAKFYNCVEDFYEDEDTLIKLIIISYSISNIRYLDGFGINDIKNFKNLYDFLMVNTGSDELLYDIYPALKKYKKPEELVNFIIQKGDKLPLEDYGINFYYSQSASRQIQNIKTLVYLKKLLKIDINIIELINDYEQYEDITITLNRINYSKQSNLPLTKLPWNIKDDDSFKDFNYLVNKYGLSFILKITKNNTIKNKSLIQFFNYFEKHNIEIKKLFDDKKYHEEIIREDGDEIYIIKLCEIISKSGLNENKVNKLFKFCEESKLYYEYKNSLQIFSELYEKYQDNLLEIPSKIMEIIFFPHILIDPFVDKEATISIDNLDIILKYINMDYQRLDEFPLELFYCDINDLDELLQIYNSNLYKNIFKLDNPKIIASLIYANNVLSKIDLNKAKDLLANEFSFMEMICSNTLYYLNYNCWQNDFEFFKQFNINNNNENEMRTIASNIIEKLRNSTSHIRALPVKDKNNNIVDNKVYLYDESERTRKNNDDKKINFGIVIDLDYLVEIVRQIELYEKHDYTISEDFEQEEISPILFEQNLTKTNNVEDKPYCRILKK